MIDRDWIEGSGSEWVEFAVVLINLKVRWLLMVYAKLGLVIWRDFIGGYDFGDFCVFGVDRSGNFILSLSM